MLLHFRKLKKRENLRKVVFDFLCVVTYAVVATSPPIKRAPRTKTKFFKVATNAHIIKTRAAAENEILKLRNRLSIVLSTLSE